MHRSKPEAEPDRELDRGDRRFVRELEALTRSPAPTASQRARFDARLAERIHAARRPRRAARVVALAACAAGVALALAVWARRPDPRAPLTDPASAAAESPEEALLALSRPTDWASRRAGLPDDYEAISALFLARR